MTIDTRILLPISLEAFFADYWEQQPLHISRASSTLYADVITEQSMRSSLTNQQLYFPGVQLTQAGRSISPESYTDSKKKIQPEKATQLHSEGATIVWSQAHDYFPQLHAFCRELQSAFKLPCLANVYLSPANQQGFNAHYDSHDVMILQVSGCKTFRFYKNGVILPFGSERFDSSIHKAGELTEEIKLEPGDTLYIPRGMMHDAVAAGDDASLHITIGIYTATYKELLQQQLELMSVGRTGLRRSVESLTTGSDASITIPADIPEATAVDSQLLVAAFEQLQDNLALDSLADPVSEEMTKPACDQLTDQSWLSVNHRNVMNLSRSDDAVKLRLFGKILHFTDPLGAAMQWILGQSDENFECQAIPSLSQEQRLALCKQLILENVVVLLI
ncbi:MAG: cupin domain-containing protein [Granulosicoccaceae bacterium]